MGSFEKIRFELGDPEGLREIAEQPPMPPFAEETIGIIRKLSSVLREKNAAQNLPDVAAFGFWCREASLRQMHRGYKDELKGRMGRGVTLHFAPGNMPVLFAYSMAAALLAGNCVMLRLPSEKTVQEMVILESMSEVMEQYPDWKKRVFCFRYNHDTEVTDRLSAMCDVRVIWGGDTSVKEIRRSPLPVRAVDIPFANRYSAAVIDAGVILGTEDLTDWARKFYQDTYLNDQNACSSPKVVYWTGSRSDIEAARERFWQAVFAYGKGRYHVPPETAVKKLEQACFLATAAENSRISAEENFAVRVWQDRLTEECWNSCMPGGFFLESGGLTPEGLIPVLNRSCQTVTCLGVDRKELWEMVISHRITGVDRIVDFGHALDFTLTWDGVDLIRQMSREILIV